MVVLIMSTLAAIAMPRYHRALTQYRARCAAQRIAADLSLAAAEARFSSTSRTVVFDVTGNQYRLVGVTHLDRPGAEYAVRLADDPYAVTLVSANLGGDASVVFDGFGAPDSSGSIVVRCGDFVRTVNLDPGTGRAAVQ